MIARSSQELFHAQLVEMAYKNLKVSSFAIWLCSLILAYIVYPFVEHLSLGIWVVLISLISAYRCYTAFKYLKDPSLHTTQEWETSFILALMTSTVLWSVAPFLFFVPENYMVQATLLIVYAGLSAGAMSSLASIIKALRLFLILLAIPLMLVLAIQNNPMHYAILILLSFYFLLIIVVGNHFHQNYRKILEMRLLYQREKKKFSASKERFEIIFKDAPIGIFLYDENLIIREMNQRFIDLLEATKEYILGLDLSTLPDKRLVPALMAPLQNHSGSYEGQYKTKLKNKELFINMQTAALKDEDGNIIGAIGIINDITEKMLAQQKVEHQAQYDILTDIPNRLTLKQRVEHEFIRFQRHGIIFAVLFLDLDHFKNINDSLGHAIGDQLLIEIAGRLKKTIRNEDTVARIGGDEFVILLCDLGEDQKQAANIAEHVALKVFNTFDTPVNLEKYQLNISTSIGIALATPEDESSDDIMKHADIAMYQAKKDGRSTTCFYQQKMDLWIKRRLELENGLKNSLFNDELQVYYQPIISLKDKVIIGAEALLRWNSKEFGNVSPVEFIPIAEDSGLIMQIGEFVLKKALEEFVKWKQLPQAKHIQKIAINISVRQFNSLYFIEQLNTLIEHSGIDASSIELELVESIIIDDIYMAKEKMNQLRKLGIGLSIDDFGTGYSSLSYLKQLPFTTLKIDRSFVKDIDIDQDDKELVETILGIAKRFGLSVVAEGVETKQQHQFLEEKECDYFQGYLCSPALSSQDIIELITKENDQQSYLSHS